MKEVAESATVLRSPGEIEAGGIGEQAKISVSRQERNTAINAALSDQRVSETRLAARCVSSPRSPFRKAIQVLLSAAIIDRLSVRPGCA